MADHDGRGLVRRMARNDPMKRAQYHALASEHDLQKLVLRHLLFHAKPDVQWFAIPNQGLRSLRTGARMKAEGMMSGVADLCILMHGGRTGWLELKTPIGRQTDTQRGFQARLERLGHIYAVARTLDEAVATLKEWGALK